VPRFQLRRAIAGGTLLSSRLSLIIATSAIALKLGVFDAATDAAMILVAIVTSIVSPVLFAALYPRGQTSRENRAPDAHER
jgi:Kef-type K+ transport system membrane component KefB